MNWALRAKQRAYDRLLDQFLTEGMPVAEAMRRAEQEAQEGYDRYCDEQMDERRLNNDRDS